MINVFSGHPKFCSLMPFPALLWTDLSEICEHKARDALKIRQIIAFVHEISVW